MDNNIIAISESSKNTKFAEVIDDSADVGKFRLIKLLNKKNFKIFIVLVIMLIAIIFYLGINDNKESAISVSQDSQGYLSTLEYCERLENKLESIISQIAGAGSVKVMVSVDGSPELKYISDTDSKTSTNTAGTTTTSTSSPIIIGSGANASGIVTTETLPNVKGVIVVSSGAGNIGIKLDILNAISTVLDLSSDKITILKGV
ncbi:MAG: hypothetical protein E7354_01380 [Clostridiales bacterium]|nr:hypothetical protein [Clostridiales bacterium]